MLPYAVASSGLFPRMLWALLLLAASLDAYDSKCGFYQPHGGRLKPSAGPGGDLDSTDPIRWKLMNEVELSRAPLRVADGEQE